MTSKSFLKSKFLRGFSKLQSRDVEFFVSVPTFLTRLTDYLCSGWVFLFRQISTFKLAIFDGIFKYHSKDIVVLSLNLRYVSPVIVFRRVMGF